MNVTLDDVNELQSKSKKKNPMQIQFIIVFINIFDPVYQGLPSLMMLR